MPTNLAIYSQDYFTGAKLGFGYVDYTEEKRVAAKTFDNYLDKIEEFSTLTSLLSKDTSISLSAGRLLDVGAATGFFLNKAKLRGWKVSGVEISEYAARQARESGLDVICGTLKDISESAHEQFDVITFFDVLEHFPDPKSQLTLAYRFLKEKGIIVINTPDSSSFWARLLGKRWPLLIPPEHLAIFNKSNLSDFLSNTGFEICFAKRIPKKFRLKYVFQTLSNTSQLWFWKLAVRLFDNFLGEVSLPFGFRQNIFVVARKV